MQYILPEAMFFLNKKNPKKLGTGMCAGLEPEFPGLD